MSEQGDSILGDLMRLIPGYGAYRDEQSRRDDDKSTREFIAKRLEDCKSGLDQMGAEAISAGDLKRPVEIEKIRSQIDLAKNRVTAALEGYASWFSSREVDAELIDRVIEVDHGLVSLVDQIDALVKQSGETDLFDATAIAEVVKLLHERIDRRNEVLKNG